MVINSTNINKNKQSPLILSEITKHKKDCVAGLNQLKESQPSPLDNWIPTLPSW